MSLKSATLVDKHVRSKRLWQREGNSEEIHRNRAGFQPRLLRGEVVECFSTKTSFFPRDHSTMTTATTVLIAFALAFPVGTLVEYVLHRWVLHTRSRTFVSRRHRMHHKSNEADTLWGDFRDFSLGGIPFVWLGFLHSLAAGLAFLAGGVCYVFLLALVHKLSHERPELIFWMSPPSHELHHCETPRHNFGIVTRFWDRVFGTYAPGVLASKTNGGAQ